MKKIIASFVLILLLPSLVSARVSCTDCNIGQCICTITDCESGILDIFSGSSCTIEPDYEFTFSNGHLEWNPQTSKSYYIKALCSDGNTQSDCDMITVKSAEQVTTTTKPRTTTTTQPSAPAQGPDFLLLGLVIALIIAIIVAVYYLFFRKKVGKSYEGLYRKWRK